MSGQFYFLIALLQFILLAPLFQSLARRWSPALLLPFALGVTWLSSMYFNSILQLFLPDASFPYSDRVFTSYLAGCCIGQHYQRFLDLLRENRELITALCLFFALADGSISLLAFSGRRSAPYLELVHTLYILSAILFIFEWAYRRTTSLPCLVQRLDRASYLIYLYHCLVIVIFNSAAARLGITRVSILFLLRILVTYTVTTTGSLLWQWAAEWLRKQIKIGGKTT